jgi:hypothetical protein
MYVYVPWERVIEELPDAVEKIRRNPLQYYFEAVTSHESPWIHLRESGKPIDQLEQRVG